MENWSQRLRLMHSLGPRLPWVNLLLVSHAIHCVSGVWGDISRIVLKGFERPLVSVHLLYQGELDIVSYFLEVSMRFWNTLLFNIVGAWSFLLINWWARVSWSRAIVFLLHYFELFIFTFNWISKVHRIKYEEIGQNRRFWLI